MKMGEGGGKGDEDTLKAFRVSEFIDLVGSLKTVNLELPLYSLIFVT